jgi:hypothetical protein
MLKLRSALPHPSRRLAFDPTFPSVERMALADMVGEADIIEVQGRRWILMPVNARQLDALACFAADLADLEGDADLEGGFAAEEWTE